jgi:hypothetical protein
MGFEWVAIALLITLPLFYVGLKLDTKALARPQV